MPISQKTRMTDLFHTQLRVPQHEPDSSAQPGTKASNSQGTATSKSVDRGSKLSASYDRLVDSVYSSLHNEVSQNEAMVISQIVPPRSDNICAPKSIAPTAKGHVGSNLQPAAINPVPEDEARRLPNSASNSNVSFFGLNNDGPIMKPSAPSKNNIPAKLLPWRRFRSVIENKTAKARGDTIGLHSIEPSTNTLSDSTQITKVVSPVGSVSQAVPYLDYQHQASWSTPMTASSVPAAAASVHPPVTDLQGNCFPKDSPFLYSPTADVYVAKSKDIKPPAEIQDQWIVLRDRLVKDMLPVLRGLPPTLSRDDCVIEPELCMSGRNEKKTNVVSLSPAIWIRCGSKKCREHIKVAVADLTYLSMYEIFVRLDAPRYV
jgi:hypothetical protein